MVEAAANGYAGADVVLYTIARNHLARAQVLPPRLGSYVSSVLQEKVFEKLSGGRRGRPRKVKDATLGFLIFSTVTNLLARFPALEPTQGRATQALYPDPHSHMPSACLIVTEGLKLAGVHKSVSRVEAIYLNEAKSQRHVPNKSA